MDFGPIDVQVPIEIQGICSDGTTTVYTDTFVITPNVTAACAITSQPVSVSGSTGTAINFGGTAFGAVIWQSAPAMAGPFTTQAGPPATIDASNDGTFWRFCCADDLAVCSDVVSVTLTTAACMIVTQPVSVSGQAGDPVNFGGTASGPATWQRATAIGGPFVDTAPPATITAADDGTFWRFCCDDNAAVCSDVVSLTMSAPSTLVDTTIVLPDQGTVTQQFCAPCAATWEIRILNPDDQFNTPNNDPGLPEPTDDAWLPVAEVAGLTCVELAFNEEWADGLNPDDQGSPNEEFFLYIRAMCAGTPTEAVLTIEV